MSLIGEIVGEVIGALLWPLLERGLHATGRRLIFVTTMGFAHIPSLREGGAGDWRDFGSIAAGLVFWGATIASALWLLLR